MDPDVGMQRLMVGRPILLYAKASSHSPKSFVK
jgi:hypothetical protein